MLTKQYKIAILGDTGCGKTSILNRYSNNKFENTSATIGIDYSVKKWVYNNKHLDINQDITFQLWDTAGQEKYMAITDNYLRDVDGILIVFDITRPQTVDNIQFWLNKALEFNCYIINIIGNKLDLFKEYDLDNIYKTNLKLKSTIEEYELGLFLTSAKSDINITNIFNDLFTKVHENTLSKALNNKKINLKDLINNKLNNYNNSSNNNYNINLSNSNSSQSHSSFYGNKFSEYLNDYNNEILNIDYNNYYNDDRVYISNEFDEDENDNYCNC